ncbi:MAG: hypothetical protein KGN79_12865 [Acidobacteriota bacterium]|nr:hypothetical protein [Acidobacteriota bacterium]
MRKSILILAATVALSTSATICMCAQNRVTVPFVGCKSDGQMGPIAAPHGHDVSVSIPANLAIKLSWYEGQYGPGVLAPRGWDCFSTYGSNGSTLFVTPNAIDSKLFFSSDWRGFSGPVIQVSIADGETSGRFEVARAIARLFPAYTQFLRNVIAEGIEPAANFPSGPFPGDKVRRIVKNIVEFETPAMQQGLGTTSRLRPDTDPIAGVAMLVGEEPSLFQLSIRTPAQERYLVRAIIKQFEQNVSRIKD